MLRTGRSVLLMQLASSFAPGGSRATQRGAYVPGIDLAERLSGQLFPDDSLTRISHRHRREVPLCLPPSLPPGGRIVSWQGRDADPTGALLPAQ